VNIVTETVAWLTDPVNWSGPNGIPVRLAEHVGISLAALLIAIAIALPIGLYIGHTGRGVSLAINSAVVWRSLPSLAVIAMVVPITAAIDPQAGFKIYPAVIAMVVLAVPPIMVNSYSGIANVDRDLIEAGRGMGYSERRLLTGIELPLSVSVILVGIRSGAVQIIATATLAAIFGFGGLGRYLVNGFAQRDIGQVMGGAILVGALVLVTDLIFAIAQRLLAPRLSGPDSAAPSSISQVPDVSPL
jgi:osmoprotectant transport system permease protein